ncbi:hypothetical protein GF373_08305 [bacterium]|nr:hypothetical protein [bacterium]
MKKAFFKASGMMGMIVSFTCLSIFAAEITVKQDGSGDHATIQAAIDAAAEGDTIVIHAGSYTEDLNIGHVNMPPAKKSDLTLKAAVGAEVTITLANNSNRLAALAAAGADFGETDYMGFLVYGDNVTLEGLKLIQQAEAVNAINVASALSIISNNVTVRDCVIEGPGPDAEGDFLGMVITPLDVISLQQGQNALAKNLTVENCQISNVPYAFAIANFPLELGVAVDSPDASLTNCEFFNCGSGIEMDDGVVTAQDCNFHDNGTGVSVSDDALTLTNSTIVNNLENGISIDDSEAEDNEPAENPVIQIENCMVLNNGYGADGSGTNHGVEIEHGTITLNNTVIANSAGNTLFLDPPADREITLTIDHCDLYESQDGVAINTPEEPENFIHLTMTNNILVDIIGVFNSFPALEGTYEYNDFFVTSDPFFPDDMEQTISDMLNVDPQYVDAENGNFNLSPDSPVATAGEGGTHLGAKGVQTKIQNWMVH